MADITTLFKATVKAIKVREQNIEKIDKSSRSTLITDNKGCQQDKFLVPDKQHTIHQSEFGQQAKHAVANISTLHEFLLKFRKDYINANEHLGGEASKLSNAERDQIDSDAELYIRTCVDKLRQLRIQANNHKVLRQVKEHKDAVLDIIDKYLSGVCQIYSQQKAVRVKRVVDHKRLARLEGDHSQATTTTRSERRSKASLSSSLASTQQRTAPAGALTPQLNNSTNCGDGGDVGGGSATHKTITGYVSPSIILGDQSKLSQDNLSIEEEQMLQMENDQVFAEMSNMVDEVRQVEGKLVEITRLQEIFTNKILQQETDINKIAETVVGTTENIKDANEEIREAMKNNAGFRIWILFFLIVCSFSLLFLDWYNA